MFIHDVYGTDRSCEPLLFRRHAGCENPSDACSAPCSLHGSQRSFANKASAKTLNRALGIVLTVLGAVIILVKLFAVAGASINI